MWIFEWILCAGVKKFLLSEFDSYFETKNIWFEKIFSEKDGGDERFTLTVGCKDSPNGLELSISKVNFDDKGDYDCVSKNRFDGEPPRKMALRVKGLKKKKKTNKKFIFDLKMVKKGLGLGLGKD